MKAAVVFLFLIVIGLGVYSYHLNTKVNDITRDLNERIFEKENAFSAFDAICESSKNCNITVSGPPVVGKQHCYKYTEDLKTREFCIQDLHPKAVEVESAK